MPLALRLWHRPRACCYSILHGMDAQSHECRKACQTAPDPGYGELNQVAGGKQEAASSDITVQYIGNSECYQ